MREEMISQSNDKVLYREKHSDTVGSFDDTLFVTDTNAIGIDVAGSVYVMTLKLWHKLAGGPLYGLKENTPSRPEPMSAEERAQKIVEDIDAWTKDNGTLEVDIDVLKADIYKTVQQAMDEARAQDHLPNGPCCKAMERAHMEGFSEGAAAMREKAYKTCLFFNPRMDATVERISEAIRTLPLSEAEGGKRE